MRFYIKILFFSSFLLSSISAFSQESLSRVRASYAEDLFLLFNHSSASKLDLILKTYQSFGDKDISNKLILESLVFSNFFPKDTAFLESINHAIRITKEDSLYLKKLPQISEHLFMLPALLPTYTAFSKSYLNQSSFLYEIYTLMENKSINFPNMPNIEDENRGVSFFNWGISYTKELDFFTQSIKKSCAEWKNEECKGDDYMIFIDSINTYFIENSFYKIWLPAYLNEEDKSFNPIISFDMMYENPKEYVYQLYDLVLERKPSEEELLSIVNYIKEKSDITPELVFLSFLLKKHE